MAEMVDVEKARGLAKPYIEDLEQQVEELLKNPEALAKTLLEKLMGKEAEATDAKSSVKNQMRYTTLMIAVTVIMEARTGNGRGM